MVFITHLGDFGMVWIILTVIFLLFNKTRKIAYMMICALLLSLLINNGILKNSFLRIRPYETIEGLTRLIEAQSDFSFPSGHSASSFAGAVVIYKMVDKKYGIIAINIIQTIPKSPKCVIKTIIGVKISFLINSCINNSIEASIITILL